MSKPNPAPLAGLVVLVATMALSACLTLRPLEERTVTLEPLRTASILSEIHADRFGVCTGVSRRGLQLYLWREFLRQRDSTVPDYPVEHMTGYDVSVHRGESCHERILNGIQAAAWFDLSTLPSTAITSATLRVHRGFVPRDPAYERGTEEQCEVIMLGEATDPWLTGAHVRRPPVSWRPARVDNGPYLALGRSSTLEADVTHTVSAWARGQRPNEGFVLSPDMDVALPFYHATDQGGFMCDMGITGLELVVTAAVAG